MKAHTETTLEHDTSMFIYQKHLLPKRQNDSAPVASHPVWHRRSGQDGRDGPTFGLDWLATATETSAEPSHTTPAQGEAAASARQAMLGPFHSGRDSVMNQKLPTPKFPG